MQVLFCMVLCLFLFSGCGTRKHSYKSETISAAISSKKDSSHITESVQQVITELIECKGTAVITVTELSKPDSIGNQYIVKTTQADIHSEQKRSVATEANRDKQETDISIQVKDEGVKDIVTNDMLIDRRSVFPGWVFGLIVILFSCFLGGVVRNAIKHRDKAV